jgi:hypothetical protein
MKRRYEELVLPDRIELSTSPLPMECSTTELRQRAPDYQKRPKRLPQAGRSLPQGPRLRKRGPARRAIKNGRNQRDTPAAGYIWVSCGRFDSGFPRPGFYAAVGWIMISSLLMISF